MKIYELKKRAAAAGISCEVVKPKKGGRTHQALGSRWSPPMPLRLNGKKFSLAGAAQYIAAREK